MATLQKFFLQMEVHRDVHMFKDFGKSEKCWPVPTWWHPQSTGAEINACLKSDIEERPTMRKKLSSQRTGVKTHFGLILDSFIDMIGHILDFQTPVYHNGESALCTMKTHMPSSALLSSPSLVLPSPLYGPLLFAPIL